MADDFMVTHENGSFCVDPDRKNVYGESCININGVCVKCGSTDEGGEWIDKTLYYVNPLIYLCFFIGLLVVLIAYYVVRQPVDVQYYLCNSCSERLSFKRKINLFTWLGFGAVVIAAIAMQSGILGLAGFGMFIAGIITAYMAEYPIKVTKYNKSNDNFTLNGFCADFFRNINPE